MLLYGPVGFVDFDGTGFTSSDVKAALATMSGDITVRVNSGGGLAFDGIAIHNALQAHPGKVTAIVDALAASAATLPIMAADTIVMNEGALIMIHDPSAISFGTSESHRKAADVLDLLGEQAAGIYARRSGLPIEAVRAIMRAETWFDGPGAEENGFADLVLASPPEEAMAFDFSLYAHAPAHLMRMSRPIQRQDLPSWTTAAPAAHEEEATMPVTAPAEPSVSARDLTADIMSRCRAARLSLEEASEVLAKATSPDMARDLIIDMVAARDPSPEPRPHLPTSAVGLEPLRQRAYEDALHAKMTGRSVEGQARHFASMRLPDLARSFAEDIGISGARMWTPRQAVEWATSTSGRSNFLAGPRMNAGMHSTSDFPALLGGVAHKVAMDAYQAAESPLMRLVRIMNTSDFKPIQASRLSEMPSLEEVPEAGEYTYGSRAETSETFSIKTYGRMFAITRQALINDDLSMLATPMVEFGRAASRKEADLLAALLANDGPTLDDGTALFATSRSNKASTGSGISVSSLSDGRQAMRNTKGIDGTTFLNLAPRYLVVGTAKETEAEQALAALDAAAQEDVNVFAGRLEILVEPRIAGNRWMLFADPAQASVLGAAWLDGQRGPNLLMREGWEVDGTEYRARLDFGCGALGWRGAYLNPGN
ncbi:head maturation protease, ClpP-related [Mongoliimonas terrestris]|uniref:head maturation protease, ClpP-related n=1 Tax=Mongoliimonas terrestris TaxID=1709001 RepID=UPI00094959B4|nr:head maturation protease, ClpP-related [Mongoliimonas terrestris]